MNITGIVLVFLFLAIMVVGGIVLLGFGVNKTLYAVRNNIAEGKALQVSMDVVMATVGLLLTSSGALSVFRIVWG